LHVEIVPVQNLDILQEWGKGNCFTRKRGMEEVVVIA
jgi:hypothetical protein